MAILTLLPTTMEAKKKSVVIKIIETSDVHGCFFPYDFIQRKPLNGTLARVSTYVMQQREKYGKNVILIDNGDILQGQPSCYYSNYIKPEMPNVAASVINYMGYDAQTFGNHDVETGHSVYDKWIKEVNCPMLGANIIETKTGKPYVHPYTIIEREGIRIAIIGMLTPAIPNWLNEELWSGLRFEEMVRSAKYWMEYIKSHENPDVVVGLFHSGKDGGIVTEEYAEDASLKVAREVPGFDVVMFGHDHSKYNDVVKNIEGKDVVCLDPSCNALLVAEATVRLTVGKKNRILSKQVTGELVDMKDYSVDTKLVNHFQASVPLWTEKSVSSKVLSIPGTAISAVQLLQILSTIYN